MFRTITQILMKQYPYFMPLALNCHHDAIEHKCASIKVLMIKGKYIQNTAP